MHEAGHAFAASPPRPAPYDPDDPKSIAMHEAGHAVAAIVLGFDLKSVDIVGARPPRWRSWDSRLRSRPRFGARRQGGRGRAAAHHPLDGGPPPEAMVNPHVEDREYDAHRMDVESEYRAAVVSICDLTKGADGLLEVTREERVRNADRLQAVYERGEAAADKLVQTYRPAIEEVTALLLKRKRLTGAEVAAIVDPYRVPGLPRWSPDSPRTGRRSPHASLCPAQTYE